jgi:hypothetical protein
MDAIHKKSLARARFAALQNHSPEVWDENAVLQYHEVVTELEEACSVDLSRFRIPNAEVKPLVVGATRRPRSGRFLARVQMSAKAVLR